MPKNSLEQLLAQREWTEEKLAMAAGRYLPRGREVSQSTISRLRTGKRRTSLPVALAIEQATGGQVRAESLRLSPEDRQLLRNIRAGLFCEAAAA